MWPEPAVVVRAALMGWLAFGLLLMVAQAFLPRPPDPDAVLA